jgi:hypothetical protein
MTAPTSVESAFDPTIQKMMDEVTPTELFHMDSEIVNLSQPDRYHGSPRLDAVRQWLGDYAKTNGGPRLRVETWYTNQSDTYKSLRIVVPGEDPTAKWVITTGGHMDTVRNAPGADDDGSGTVGAVLTCTILSRYKLRATVECFGWDGHECCWPNPSSYDYATTMKQANVDMRGYFNQDMISYDPNNQMTTNVIGRSQDKYLYDQTAQIVANYNTGLKLAAYDSSDRASDQLRFHQAGYDGIFFIENTFNTPNYHKPTDTMDKVNMKLAAAVVKAVIGNIATMAEVMTGGPAARIEVSPQNATTQAGSKLAFSAQGFDSAGNPVSVSANWAATGGTIAANGEFSSFKTGTFTVFANTTNPPLSGSTQVMVTAGPLAIMNIAPDSVALTADDYAQFVATGADAYGNSVAVSPQWAASGGAISGSGLYNAGPVGAWTVYANQSGVGDSAVVTVSAGMAVSMTVDPAVATVRADKTLQFKAEAADTDSNPVPVSPTWTTTGGAVGASGLYTPDKVGDYTVTATDGSLSASGKVSVTPGSLASVAVDPAKLMLKVGESADLAISAADSKSNDIAAFAARWASTNLGSFNGSGGQWKFTAKSAGKSTVKADVTSDGITRTAEVEITVEEKPVVPGVPTGSGGLLLGVILLAVVAAVLGIAAAALARLRKRPPEQRASYGSGQEMPPPGY